MTVSDPSLPLSFPTHVFQRRHLSTTKKHSDHKSIPPLMDSHTVSPLHPSQRLQSLLSADSPPSFHCNSPNSAMLCFSPQSFAEPSMADFNITRPRRPRSEIEDEEKDPEEEFPSKQPEKKRRLTAEQVQLLEKSFEVDNKLEPKRKNELAKDLHLQPRQVAIWFQNRRARFKTKQLERDYGALKSTFDSLKSRYDHLLQEKDQLQNEVSLLRAELKLREGNSNSMVKGEVASSVKSDVFDSDSPHSMLQSSDFSQKDLAGSFMEVAEGDFQGGCYWPLLF